MDKVAISNIAWPTDQDREALSLCARCGFTGIEIAPGKTFTDWPRNAPDIGGLKAIVANYGLSVVALQAILVGIEGVELFRSDETRARLAKHLREVAKLAGVLGARACVYGAPRSRDPGQLPFDAALNIAIDFFSSIAPAFEAEGTCLAFEANDASYGCRFVTRTTEAIDLVRRVSRPGVRVQIDTGTVFLGNEENAVITEAVSLAGHFHASEPQLAPVGSGNSDHQLIAAALRAAGYDGWMSVEMRQTDDWRGNIERAADLMATVYRPPSGPAK
ncbi:MAG TPA: sugar phosphate isomerase/epimerase [Bradyrhizobium sp.]